MNSARGNKPMNMNPPAYSYGQSRILNSVARKLLILSPPGTGKTVVLLGMIRQSIDAGSDSRPILFLCFSRKIAKKIGKTFIGHAQVEVRTLHSFCHRTIRRYHQELGYAFPPKVMSKEAELGQARRIFKKRFKNAGKEEKANLKSVFMAFVKNGLPIEDRLKEVDPSLSKWRKKLLAAQKEFEDFKLQGAQMSFHDQISKACALFKKNPSLLEAVGKQYQAILVDEFQDITGRKYEVACQLASVAQRFVAAGDDAQSIFQYGLAPQNNFLDFKRRFHYVKVYRLAESYRSTQGIVELLNAMRKTLGVTRVTMRSSIPGPPPALIECDTPNHMDAKIVDIIDALHVQEKIPYGRICILGRTKHSLTGVHAALLKAGIPADLGGVKLAMKISKCANLVIDIALGDRGKCRALMVELGYGLSDLAYESFEKKQAVHDKRLAYLVKRLKFIEKYDNLDCRIKMIRECLCYYMDDAKKAYIHAHFNAIKFLSRQCASLEDVSSVIAAYPPMGDARPVKLSTIHSCKGLEYEAVIVADMVEGYFPYELSLGHRLKMEEEERLLHVAASRASRHLYLMNRPKSIFNMHANRSEGVTSECPLLTEALKAKMDIRTAESPVGREVRKVRKVP